MLLGDCSSTVSKAILRTFVAVVTVSTSRRDYHGVDIAVGSHATAHDPL